MKCWGFIALIVSAFSSSSAVITWRDCTTNKANQAITVTSMDFHPNPVVFPGDFHFSINLNVNRNISQVFVDVELTKKSLVGSIPIPCIGNTNIGTCSNIDACNILTDILSGSSTVLSAKLGQQINKALTDALGHAPQCPIIQEQLVLNNVLFHLEPLSNLLSTIADGHYHMKIMLKDDPTSTENVGCLEFDGSVARKHSGFLFN